MQDTLLHIVEMSGTRTKLHWAKSTEWSQGCRGTRGAFGVSLDATLETVGNVVPVTIKFYLFADVGNTRLSVHLARQDTFPPCFCSATLDATESSQNPTATQGIGQRCHSSGIVHPFIFRSRRVAIPCGSPISSLVVLAKMRRARVVPYVHPSTNVCQ